MVARRVLITGATGFVGANLSRRVLRDGHSLYLLLRPGHNRWRLNGVAEEAECVVADLTDANELRKKLRQLRPEWIFHLAAYGAYSFQTQTRAMIDINIGGTLNLVQAATETEFEVFVNTGSSSEYGFKNHPTTENDVLEPNSFYAVTKATGTLLCQHIARSQNLRIPTLRLYSVYGPYEDSERLIPTLIRHGLAGQLPRLASPNIARDFVHVDDVCDAYLSAVTARLDDPGSIINIGTGVQTRLDEIVSITRAILEIEQEPEWDSMPARPWDSDTWIADVTKAEITLSWRAKIDIRRGLARTIDWCRQHLEWLDPVRSARRGHSAD